MQLIGLHGANPASCMSLCGCYNSRRDFPVILDYSRKTAFFLALDVHKPLTHNGL